MCSGATRAASAARLALAAFCMLLATAVSGQDAATSLVGTLHLSHNGAWSLQTATQQYQLAGNVSDSFYPGSLVRAEGTLNGSELEQGAQLSLLSLPQLPKAVQQPTGRISARSAVLPESLSTSIGMLVVLLDFCGAGMRPAATQQNGQKVEYKFAARFLEIAQEMEGILFGEDKAADKPNLSSYYDYCSAGKAKLDRSTAKVLGPVYVPCNGTNQWGRTWVSTGCAEDDFGGWAEVTVTAAKQQLGEKEFERFKNIVMILPKGYNSVASTPGINTCTLKGTADVGPSYTLPGGAYGYGLVWLGGESVDTPHVFMHEVSHNLYVQHARKAGCEYCDDTAVMGYCCSTRCHNAPHQWQLGWTDPVGGQAQIVATLPPGVHHSYALPPQHAPGSQVLILDLAGHRMANGKNAPRDLQYFLGYRQRHDVYDAIAKPLANATHVYSMLAASRSAAAPSDYLSQLKTGTHWRDSSSGIVFNQRSTGDAGSQVTVCVPVWGQAQVESECFDGLDGDCDGLTDAEDPDCAGVAAKPPSTPPSPPPPSPPPATPAPTKSSRPVVAAATIAPVLVELVEPAAEAAAIAADVAVATALNSGVGNTKKKSRKAGPSPPPATTAPSVNKRQGKANEAAAAAANTAKPAKAPKASGKTVKPAAGELDTSGGHHRRLLRG